MNLIPATVFSYARGARTCRITIDGSTDGASEHLEAEFNNPLGDKSEHTEIRILPGDRVWVAFINGDPRYPVIMGFRPKNAGNSTLHRRFHHEHIDLEADDGDITSTASDDITETAGRDIKETAEQDITNTAGRDFNATAEADANISAGENVVIQAGTQITLQVGGSSITLTGAQIAAIAARIDLN